MTKKQFIRAGKIKARRKAILNFLQVSYERFVIHVTDKNLSKTSVVHTL